MHENILTICPNCGAEQVVPISGDQDSMWICPTCSIAFSEAEWGIFELDLEDHDDSRDVD